METNHKIYFKNSSDMSEIESETIDLLITSPPYPMIEMWDDLFSSMNEDIKLALQGENGLRAFDLMHKELDIVWKETKRIIKPGGIVCINVGDATRTIDDTFQLFPNHVKITDFFHTNGFAILPCILWRKPTNSPNKFLGSGMLPPNAYVTLEHEYILIFRKGNKKRTIEPKEKYRYNSAYFWEERNKWFSDVWSDIRGISQSLQNNNIKSQLRERSAAFPLELPYRLINMFSIYGDTIVDPFWGTGTTTLAAMISARNSIGYEVDHQFLDVFRENIKNIKIIAHEINFNRIRDHIEFTKTCKEEGKELKYDAVNYKFPVFTRQENNILLYSIQNCTEKKNQFIVNYENFELK
jgi:DNA modification methylase